MCSVHVVLVLLYCYCLQYPILDIWWIRYSNTASSNVVFILWSWSWRNFEMRKFSSSATTQSQLNSANKLLNSEVDMMLWTTDFILSNFSQLEVKKSWGRKFLEDFSGMSFTLSYSNFSFTFRLNKLWKSLEKHLRGLPSLFDTKR